MIAPVAKEAIFSGRNHPGAFFFTPTPPRADIRTPGRHPPCARSLMHAPAPPRLLLPAGAPAAPLRGRPTAKRSTVAAEVEAQNKLLREEAQARLPHALEAYFDLKAKTDPTNRRPRKFALVRAKPATVRYACSQTPFPWQGLLRYVLGDMSEEVWSSRQMVSHINKLQAYKDCFYKPGHQKAHQCGCARWSAHLLAAAGCGPLPPRHHLKAKRRRAPPPDARRSGISR